MHISKAAHEMIQSVKFQFASSWLPVNISAIDTMIQTSSKLANWCLLILSQATSSPPPNVDSCAFKSRNFISKNLPSINFDAKFWWNIFEFQKFAKECKRLYKWILSYLDNVWTEQKYENDNRKNEVLRNFWEQKMFRFI